MKKLQKYDSFMCIDMPKTTPVTPKTEDTKIVKEEEVFDFKREFYYFHQFLNILMVFYYYVLPKLCSFYVLAIV